uniref:Translation factor GUF1 homolog, mitochondrial n=1 Tax=Cacopsylla melanoneura TaxID=428564 RepID=A0A8D8RNX2_9HEMI
MFPICLVRLARCGRRNSFLTHQSYVCFYSTNPTIPESKGKSSESKKSSHEDIPISRIRNFSIIAHVDHGKSTLADRLLEMTGTVLSSGSSQVLDSLQVEQERGITVKAQTASLRYTSILDGEEYLLNLIDTPGHVDFSNEVNRSLAACQGVLLLIDANQGVQAQTVANYYLAKSQNLLIVPVLNKIDLKGANPEACEEQLKTLFDIDPKSCLRISAKTGLGVDELMEEIILLIPPPPSNRDAPLCALLYDSWYDRYRGNVIVLFIKDGHIRVGETIQFVHTGLQYSVKSVGVLLPQETPTTLLSAGQVGFITCNMRTVKEAHIGDTVHLKGVPVPPLIGFKRAQPMVFSGVYPLDQSQHTSLRGAIEKLVLNDSAVTVSVESSAALGQGWRLGFLGLLHLEVFNQRLEQEFDAQALMTVPSVTYKARIKGEKNIKAYGGSEIIIHNPSFFPSPQMIDELFEPVVSGTLITPVDYVGQVMPLIIERRGTAISSRPLDTHRVMIQADLPLNEIIVDFHDRLKSATSGFASFDYEDKGYVSSKLVKLDILLNGHLVEELSTIVHISKAQSAGKSMTARLLEIIPKQQFTVAIQAVVGSDVLARETLKALRKDVTQKLKSGGDMQRRRKLLEQQAEGKKKLRLVANIALPRETFIKVYKR